jgi:signal transduction histidine kinase
MINTLYELSALDIGKVPLKTEKLDLNQLLREVLAGQYELSEKFSMVFSVDLPDRPVWITGDRVPVHALRRIY